MANTKALEDMLDPTPNQLQFIGVIEKNLNITFHGETRRDAAKFISKNYAILKRKRSELRRMWQQ